LQIPFDVYDYMDARKISANGRAVIICILRGFNGANNGRIACPVRAGEKIGMSKNTFARALKEVVNAGFLTIETASSFNRKSRRAAEYGIAWRSIDGRPPTLGFRSVPKPEINHSPIRGTYSPIRGTEGGQEAA
jgi:hypothetical protein